VHLAPPGGSYCHVLLQGHDAEVVFSSSAYDVEPWCSTWVSKFATGGELWIENGPISNLNVAQICSLSDNDVMAAVYDSGAAEYGQEACTSLLGTGQWKEQSSPTVPYR
jgi:hypothetical protein